MPRVPKGEKRPADAIGNAVMIARIATGEIEDLTTDDGKNAAAMALGPIDIQDSQITFGLIHEVPCLSAEPSDGDQTIRVE